MAAVPVAPIVGRRDLVTCSDRCTFHANPRTRAHFRKIVRNTELLTPLLPKNWTVAQNKGFYRVASGWRTRTHCCRWGFYHPQLLMSGLLAKAPAGPNNQA